MDEENDVVTFFVKACYGKSWENLQGIVLKNFLRGMTHRVVLSQSHIILCRKERKTTGYDERENS